MFPSKGTTVWVNFRDKPYLGKVLQTSPELDMVCVRISNYLDHVARNEENEDLFSHSCPESNSSVFPSSVIITCGFDDVFPLDSNISHEFQRMHLNCDASNNSLENYNNEDEQVNSSHSCVRLLDTTNHDDNQKEESFSNSFGINNILNNSYKDNNQNTKKQKIWKCRFCNLHVCNENNMNHHILSEHQLESHLGPDNWIVIGGVRGFEYEEVKYEESLSNELLSNNVSRKRQFSEFMSSMEDENQELSTRRDLQFDSFETSMRSDTENNCNEFNSDEVNLPIVQQIIQKTRSLTQQIGKFTTGSFNHNFSNPSKDYTERDNECIDFQSQSSIFSNFFINRSSQPSISLPFPIALPPFYLSERYRSSSLSSNDPIDSTSNIRDYELMFSAPKRNKLEINSKKCRKMYGIEQRHLWCNQCKWKKACSRFSYEMNTSI